MLVVGVPKETFPGERRVAIVPDGAAALKKAGLSVLVESGAGLAAGFDDAAYTAKGAELAPQRSDVFAKADVLLQIRVAGANRSHWPTDLGMLRSGQSLIGLCDPLGQPDAMRELAAKGSTCFSLELLPRITRAQSMDVLSSMAMVSGYKAVLLAAEALPRLFPMMITAAGTITPAKVFVMGAGVAGLQAIATARRLGAVIQAYDVRSAVKEEVQSLGAKFVELPLETGAGGGSGGYAAAMGEEFYRRQRELMTKVVAANDVVITTASVPGKTAPLLVTADMVKGMLPGSVIVDLAAEQGGNCELTQPNQTVVENGVTILGPVNLPSTIPYHASQLFSKNVTTFLLNMIKDATLHVNLDDEIVGGTLVTRGGEIVHPRLNDASGPA